MWMTPLFRYSHDVPDDWEHLPGIWKNRRGSGFRIPLNLLNYLGVENSMGRSDPDHAERILRSLAFHPWVADIVMPHQREIIAHSLVRKGYHAWSPPGSGKTLCGLAWIAAAVKKPKVVITKAAARGTWREEIRKFTRFQPVLLKGIKNTSTIHHDPRCVYIVAWETLIYWRQALIKLRPHSLVMDEIHWAKNPKRVKPIIQPNGGVKFEPLHNASYAASAIAQVAERRLGLTATPIPNRPRDLWAQLDLIEPWQWGTFHNFGARYCAGFKDVYGWKYDGLSNSEELYKRLDWSRYETDQKAVMKNLPPKRRQIIYLDREEQNAPSGFKRDIKQAHQVGDRESVFEVMLQEAASRKRKYIVERVVEAIACKQKVVIFTGRRKDCDVLGDAIKAKVNVQVWVAHGGTTTEKRDKIRQEYMQLSDPCVLVGTGDAWGESVNLQDTDIAFFVMLPWTPRSIRQWEGRFSRTGQKRPVLISFIIARGTVDEHVSDILLNKLPLVGALIDDQALTEIEEDLSQTQEDLLSRIAGLAPDLS